MNLYCSALSCGPRRLRQNNAASLNAGLGLARAVQKTSGWQLMVPWQFALQSADSTRDLPRIQGHPSMLVIEELRTSALKGYASRRSPKDYAKTSSVTRLAIHVSPNKIRPLCAG